MGVILKGIGGATRLDMSSEKLEEHEEILRHLLRELETQVSHTLPTASGDDLSRGVHQAELKLRTAEEEHSGMQLELRNAPRNFQQQYSLSMAKYKNQLSGIKRQITSYSATSVRDELISRDQQPNSFGTINSSYDQMLVNTESLHRATSSLNRAQQVSAETDQIADGIMEDLNEQRSTLIRTRNKVSGFDAQLDQSRTLMRKIACHSIQNRFILIGVVVLELIVLAIVTWYKFFR